MNRLIAIILIDVIFWLVVINYIIMDKLTINSNTAVYLTFTFGFISLVQGFILGVNENE